MQHDKTKLNRRGFLKTTAVGIGAATAGISPARAAENESSRETAKVDPKDLIWRNKVPTMEYRRMGRTNFMVSRIVAGWGGNEALWRRLLQRGINYIDTARGYGNHEEKLQSFLKKYRDKVWITSKSTDIAGYKMIDPQVIKLYLSAIKNYLDPADYDRMSKDYEKRGPKERQNMEFLRFHEAAMAKFKATGKKPDLRPAGKRIASLYTQKLDESLQRMKIDHVDCYMVHGIEIPWIFDCTELWDAYQKVHKAGKVKHFGYSTHKHIKEVLAAGLEANTRGPWKIDLIMPSINPESFDAPNINLKWH